MNAARCLIVNADDFGLSAGINRGIVEAHERGIVTSASLMVRWPDAADAAAYARSHRRLGVGLHVDLGEWKPERGAWVPLYEVLESWDEAGVAREVGRQLDRFRDLLGMDPTHLDSHQHVHDDEPLRTILQRLAHTLGVPMRNATELVRYVGGFYGQGDMGRPYPEGVSVLNLLNILESLPAGVTELGCHPGYDGGLVTTYRHEREQEVQTLTDPRIRTAIRDHHIRLMSFEELNRER